MFGQLFPSGGGAPIPLRKERVIFGRSPACDVVVRSSRISGRHCALLLKNGQWWVKDLGSRNGTGVNGKRVQTAPVLPGHILCLPGKRFRIDYQAAAKTESVSADSLAMEALDQPISEEVDSVSRESPVIDRRGLPTRKKSPAANYGIAAAESSSRPGSTLTVETPDSGRKRFLGKLTPVGGGPPFPLMQSHLVIGRSRSADLRIKTATVSAKHCSLSLEDGYWWVQDMDSSNGIRVNGEKVDRRCLMPGDKFSVSKHRFVIDYTPEGEPPRDPGLFSRSLLEKAGLENILDSEEAPAWITSHETRDDDSRTRYRLDDSDPD